MSDTQTMICFYDSNGKLLNIGPWDYKAINDYEGNVVVCNPLPDGATSKQEQVITNEDGSRSVVTAN